MVNDEFMNQTTGWKDVSHARRSGEVGGYNIYIYMLWSVSVFWGCTEACCATLWPFISDAAWSVLPRETLEIELFRCDPSPVPFMFIICMYSGLGADLYWSLDRPIARVMTLSCPFCKLL